MWLPIIGFCDGVVMMDNFMTSLSIKNGALSIRGNVQFFHVRSVSVKVTKAGPEWYDGYKFEIQVVSQKKMMDVGNIIMTVQSSDLKVFKKYAALNVFMWGNHAAYRSHTVEHYEKTKEKLFIHTFQGVQINKEQCREKLIFYSTLLGK